MYSLLIEPVRQRLFPQLTLLYFLLPRARIALQRLKIAVGGAQEALPAIAFDSPVQNRLHRRLFLFRQLPQQFMRVRADADVWRAAVWLHSGIIACVRWRIQFCIQNWDGRLRLVQASAGSPVGGGPVRAAKGWNRVGGALRPRPPTPPYVLVVYGGFSNVVTSHI